MNPIVLFTLKQLMKNIKHLSLSLLDVFIICMSSALPSWKMGFIGLENSALSFLSCHVPELVL